MSTAASRSTGTSPGASIVAQINAFFYRYGSTFAALAAGKRCDLDALLNFYSAPFRYIGADFHMVLRDSGDIIGPNGIGGEVVRLRGAGYQGSVLDKCEVTVLNERATLVTATWRRQEEPEAVVRFTVVYLVALTAEGWRITTAANVSG